MQIVAGLSLRNLAPRIWDTNSEYYIPELEAVIISYADFHQVAKARQQAMAQGLHAYLNIPSRIKIYLDNGAFYFLTHGGQTPVDDYLEFVEKAKPDWYPIPQDFIPTPSMSMEEQYDCFSKTMLNNQNYANGEYVPIVHISTQLAAYNEAIVQNIQLNAKSHLAIGGIVPNLLRSPKAISHNDIIENLRSIRKQYEQKNLHIFGIGGTSTVHLAMLLKLNSADSCGWRNRAARGIIQLPGSGDRSVADLGKWRGRTLSVSELELLKDCRCPSCLRYGIAGLQANKVAGFHNRATHNLWILLQEATWVRDKLQDKTYKSEYRSRLDNTHYLPLIQKILEYSSEENCTVI